MERTIEMNEIRELTADELDHVNGGIVMLLGALALSAALLAADRYGECPWH